LTKSHWSLCINWLWARQFLYFEVALKNGIPFSLINRAKKKIEVGKVLTKPLPPTKGTIKDGKTSQMLKEEETKARRRKEDGND
jgi:hypothetical protein